MNQPLRGSASVATAPLTNRDPLCPWIHRASGLQVTLLNSYILLFVIIKLLPSHSTFLMVSFVDKCCYKLRKFRAKIKPNLFLSSKK